MLNIFSIEPIFYDTMHPGATIGRKPCASISLVIPHALSPVHDRHDFCHWCHGRQHSCDGRKKHALWHVWKAQTLIVPFPIEADAVGLEALKRGHDLRKGKVVTSQLSPLSIGNAIAAAAVIAKRA